MSGCGGGIFEERVNVNAAYANAKLSREYLNYKQIYIAKHKLLLALKQAPDDSYVHCTAGYFFAHTGEPYLAEKHYLVAIKYALSSKDKDNDKIGDSWHNYGIFLYNQGRYQESLKYFLLAAKDSSYLFVAKAYADASSAALKLKQNTLAWKYHICAMRHFSVT